MCIKSGYFRGWSGRVICEWAVLQYRPATYYPSFIHVWLHVTYNDCDRDQPSITAVVTAIWSKLVQVQFKILYIKTTSIILYSQPHLHILTVRNCLTTTLIMLCKCAVKDLTNLSWMKINEITKTSIKFDKKAKHLHSTQYCSHRTELHNSTL